MAPHTAPLTDRPATPWPEARDRLARAGTYWLVTTGRDGRPHVVPIVAVQTGGALHFVASGGSRKARHLAAEPRCVVAASADGIDVVVHGRATPVRDPERLQAVARAYADKYDWHPTPRDGAFHDVEGAPTAGPPPFGVYALTPDTGYGFATGEDLGAARWDLRDDA
jgi:nitroimidazol reductase NimA-like FMN-containing flavoprotein (pyridoxamine 5'-phosphate oxidase superfamily)